MTNETEKTAEARAAAVDRMLARDAIRDVLARYARGIDRADGALLKSCYFDDAIEEHGSSFTGRAHDYVDGAIPKVRTMGVMQHLLGNCHIELDGDRAYVETYVWTFLRVERRNGTWKIAHRRTVFDWNRDTPSNEGWCLGYIDPRAPGVRRGTKDKSDPTYEKF